MLGREGKALPDVLGQFVAGEFLVQPTSAERVQAARGCLFDLSVTVWLVATESLSFIRFLIEYVVIAESHWGFRFAN